MTPSRVQSYAHEGQLRQAPCAAASSIPTHLLTPPAPPPPPPTHPPEMGMVLTKVVKERPPPRVKVTREVDGRKALAVTCTSGTCMHRWRG